MTCEDCKFYEKECDVHFHQEIMGRKRNLKICEIFYPKEPRFIEVNLLINDLLEAEASGGMGSVVARTIIRYVKRRKIVDAVEVVHGRWLSEMHGNSINGTCSVCGSYEHAYAFEWKYCPNCGALMDGDK